MANYEIRISRTAEKQLRLLSQRDQVRVARAMLALGSDPLPRGSRKLSGYEDVHRIRVGRYRILYSLTRRELVIIILKVGPRRDVYR